MSQYRVTVLTPTLAGDGNKLAPIDYMVWKDQVNVLDQRRIFKLLAKGSRLEPYLAQIKRVDKLDFTSWGGYAQNYALRRIALDDPSITEIHTKERPENLFIPTFACNPGQAFYLPASVLKGPLRTALTAHRLRDPHLAELGGRMNEDRPPRRPGLELEAASIGSGGHTRTRSLQLTDSDPLSGTPTRVYLVRTSTLIDRGKSLELGWKTSPRGAVDSRRMQDSTPLLTEMAVPGSTFVGRWQIGAGFKNSELLRMLRWKEATGPEASSEAANLAAEQLLLLQREYTRTAGLHDVERTVEALLKRLEELRAVRTSCLLCLGWGGGFLAKALLREGSLEAIKGMLRNSPFYGSALRTSLPFPKTRRIIFQKGRPASLPGWVQLDFLD